MKQLTPVVFSCIIGLLLVMAFAGSHGYLHLRELNREIDSIAAKNRQLESAVAELNDRIKVTGEGGFELEKMAREDLGFSRPGDTVYIFSENGKSSLRIDQK